jgi:heme A synthase
MRAVFRWWSAILIAAVLVQIGFAGYGAFYAVDKADNAPKMVTSDQVDHGFAPHQFGYLVILLGILLVPIAFAAKVDRTRRRMSIVIAVLLILQFVLAILGWAWAPLGFLHPLNALAIAAVTGMLARMEWKGGPEPATEL